MKFRQSYLMNLNSKLFSQNFIDFFLGFWVSKGCQYLSYPGCPTAYNQIFNQGSDQVWSLLVRKLDYVAGLLLPILPTNKTLYTSMGNATANYIVRNITTFYETDIINVFNNNLV